MNNNKTPGKRGRPPKPKKNAAREEESSGAKRGPGRPRRERPAGPPTEKLQRLPVDLIRRVHEYQTRQENSTGYTTSLKNLLTEAWSLFEGSAEHECLTLLQWEQRKLFRRILFFLVTEPRSVERQRLNSLLEMIDEWIVFVRQSGMKATEKPKKNAKKTAPGIRPDTPGGT